MEEKVAGFTVTGTWGDIVEHGERITLALESAGVDTDSDPFVEWDEWRPKLDERLDEDVNEKTAEKAATEKGVSEKEGNKPDDDLKSAVNEANESISELKTGDPKKSAYRWQEAVEHLARGADSVVRRGIRHFELFLYKNVMTTVSPYYFDNELVKANISKTERGGEPVYTLQVDITDDDLKATVSDQLSDLEESVPRWHLELGDKETTVAEASEGAEVTQSDVESSTRESGSVFQDD